MELKVEVEDPDFDLERAVCSHGLFMMAPNQWDPATRTFQRPLRLSCPSPSYLSVVVRISHPYPRPSHLHVSVSGTDSLSPQHQEALLARVRRMLRISHQDDQVVKEFHKMHPVAKERGFGRIFRSPTLFEDMVKCILLCNCQWSRTLSMAKELCELQLEVKGCSTAEHFQPKTPQQKEYMGKCGRKEKVKIRLMFDQADVLTNVDSGNTDDSSPKYRKRQKSDPSAPLDIEILSDNPNPCQISKINDVRREGIVSHPSCKVGDFPVPEELAGLDEDFLAKRCGLGYRAKRILSLARGIVERKIQLEELEAICDISNLSSYDKLNEQLSSLDGFGPFTRANVLMCMGFFHKIPADSETIRHLKQFHLRSSTIRMIEEDAEDLYGEFAPFQFLAYWSELWNFYEQRFGKLSEIPKSDYQLITASNMKDRRTAKKWRMKKKILTE
uniref:N-glycosylase/DNA lyase n=1 Tax=Anthurium amnicola TaxID=1678845 RepID=A0A1D1YA35_9ARAE